MTTQEMMKTTCPKGYWFTNAAKIDQEPNWQIEVAQPDIDPNDTRLFGYEHSEFMAKQYK